MKAQTLRICHRPLLVRDFSILLSRNISENWDLTPIWAVAQYARRVTLGMRARSLRGVSDYLVRQVEATPNIQVRYGCFAVRREALQS